MGIKKIILGLFIFVMCSIIVISISSPNSLKSVGSAINNAIKPTIANITQYNYVKLIPYEMNEYNAIKDYYKSCAGLESMAEANGVLDVEQKVCREVCGERNMNYEYYSCDKDLLICYCSS